MTDTNAEGVLQISGDLPDQELGQLTLDLARDLREAGLGAELQSAAAEPGQRGEVITLGHIAIVFLTSGAAVALIECVKTYLAREPSLSITMTNSDGRKVSLSAKNIDASSTKEVIVSLNSALKKTSK